jgi:hypothetical protein
MCVHGLYSLQNQIWPVHRETKNEISNMNIVTKRKA